MRNVLGLILTLGGTGLIWSGGARRARTLAASGGDPARRTPRLPISGPSSVLSSTSPWATSPSR